MSKKNAKTAKTTKAAKPVDDSPPVQVVPPATEREKMMLADLRKWEKRAKTLQRQVQALVEDVKARKRAIDLLNDQARLLSRAELNAERFDEIVHLVGKPVVYCPVCYRLRLSDTGNSGTQLCPKCGLEADRELWSDEPQWSLVGGNILRHVQQRYSLAR